MYIDTDTAWDEGFTDYGTNDDCPYVYTDLKQAWWEGWWNALAMIAVHGGTLRVN